MIALFSGGSKEKTTSMTVEEDIGNRKKVFSVRA